MEGNYNLSDIAAVTGGNEGMFGGGGMWIFALLILVLLGNGGGLLGGAGRAATADDIQRSTDFSALERQNNEGVAATRQTGYDIAGAVKDGNYNILGEMRDLQAATAQGFSTMQNCCCDLKYEMATQIAGINSNIDNKFAALQLENKNAELAAMRDRINQLQLQQALCGIPKINPYGYNVTPALCCQ